MNICIYYVTKICSNKNSYTSLTKEVKYHCLDEITVVTLYGWRNNGDRSNTPATSDFLDAIFAAHVTAGLFLQNDSAWFSFKFIDMPSNYIHFAIKPAHCNKNSGGGYQGWGLGSWYNHSQSRI